MSKNDPHAKREAANYAQPIASRELIMATLEQSKNPLTAQHLADQLDINEEQFFALERRLFAMQRDGQIQKSRQGAFSLIDTESLIHGKVIAHRDGFGFLQTDSQDNDLYLSNKELRKVFDGDEVLASASVKQKNGKQDASIVQVVKRNTKKVVGKLFLEGKRCRVVPQNPKINHNIFINPDEGVKAEHEQIVVVEITRQPDAYSAPKGIISEVLGNLFDPGMEIEMALRQFDIPFEWPKATLKEANTLASEPSEADKTGRFDLRDLPFVTIDGEDAKDFDDAVYCQKKASGGWRLWVAIADVSHYVPIGSALDEEAQNRATSVYFPEFVTPMLPEAISNGLCSLKPEVDRLCMVCEMTISAKGRLSGYQFYEGVIHSHARLTYNEVGKMVQEKGDSSSLLRQDYQHIIKDIDQLHLLFKALQKERQQRGAINFETQESQFIFNTERKIEEIVPVTRNDAHKMIEECMLIANVASARFLQKHNQPCLFRVHEGPNSKKLGFLRQFLGERGLELNGQEKPTPQDYGQLLQQIEGHADKSVIQTMLLRSMSQASYQVENLGHFGLAFKAYTHFTSPIRRYPDLLVHRAIRQIIRSEQDCKDVKRKPEQNLLSKKSIYPYSIEQLVALGEHCSMAERRAEEASRDVSSWLKCEYLQQHLGNVFKGHIVAVTNFGFFVELDDLFIEGLVHVSQLGQDFFQFDQGKQRLVGEHSRQVFNLGDSVVVRVSKVELDDRKIHLQLEQSPKPKKSKNAKASYPKKADGKKKKRNAKKPNGKKPAKTPRKRKAKKP